MDIQTNAWVFQDTTTTGNGLTFKSGRNDQVTVYIISSETYTVVFEGCDSEATPNWYPIPATKLPELTTASSTTGTSNEVWVINLANFVGIRTRISATTGTIKIVGRAVNSGTSLINNVPNFVPSVLTYGIATSNGTATTLVDATKNIETDSLKDKLIKLNIDGVDFFRKITSSTLNTIGFPALRAGVASSAIVGTADTAEVTIVCATTGVAGNSYTVRAIPAPGSDDNLSASLIDTVITIYLGKTAGVLDDTKNTATLVATAVDQIPEFTCTMTGSGGVFPEISDPAHFTGGIDAITAVSGTEYFII